MSEQEMPVVPEAIKLSRPIADIALRAVREVLHDLEDVSPLLPDEVERARDLVLIERSLCDLMVTRGVYRLTETDGAFFIEWCRQCDEGVMHEHGPESM